MLTITITTTTKKQEEEFIVKKVVTPRFELGSREPKSRMLPLHHATLQNIQYIPLYVHVNSTIFEQNNICAFLFYISHQLLLSIFPLVNNTIKHCNLYIKTIKKSLTLSFTLITTINLFVKMHGVGFEPTHLSITAP